MRRRAALSLLAAAMLLGSADPGRLARNEALRAEAARQAAERSRQEAERLREQSVALTREVEAAEARVGTAEAALAARRAEAARARERLATQQAPLLKLTAAMQAAARRPAVLALVQPGSTADYARLQAVLDNALPHIRARTAAYRSEAEAAARLSAQADQAAHRLAAERDGLRGRLVALARLERQAMGDADDQLAEAMEATGRSLRFGEQARDLQSGAARRQSNARVQASLAALPSPPERPGATITGRRASYRLPVTGEVITGTGELAASGLHARGITLRTVAGHNAVAPRGGRVVHAGRFRSYGEVVIIDHGGGWTSTITGLAALAVRTGMQVEAGRTIGRTGELPVDVELRKDGRPRAIAPLLDFG